MAEPDRGRSSLPLSGIAAAIALIASAVLVHQFPLVPTRPLDTETGVIPVAQQDVDARFWQDPFVAMRAHREALRHEPKAGHKIDHASVDIIALHPQNDQNPKKLIIMPVMVWGGPYAEDAEQRRRVRYALLSGLIRSGFTLDDSRHVGYFETQHCSKAELPDAVPYEWVSSDEQAVAVLVLWLDEAAFPQEEEEPLTKIASLVNLVDPSVSPPLKCPNLEKKPVANLTVDVKVIGPNSSDMLAAILRQLVKAKQEELKHGVPASTSLCAKRRGAGRLCSLAGAHIYSPFATADEEALLRDARADRGDSILSLLKRHEIKFTRTITTDTQLMKPLLRELELRGVDLGSDVTNISVVYESDTVYGRTLLETFKNELQIESRRPPPRVKIFGYTSGLDGVTVKGPPGQREDARDRPPAESVSGRPPLDREPPRGADERAFGNTQFDYLRRLAAAMVQDAGRRGYAAVGVFGADVYDKLLILQALRPSFEGAVFFTTDLDARLLHPSESAWTRNLIVVSSFGLRLAPEIQIGPFRDSYQTATLLATRIAVNPVDIDPGITEKWLSSPRIFEIGRTAAFDLSRQPAKGHERCDEELVNCKNIHPPVGDLFPNLGMRTWGLAAIAVVLGGVLVVWASAHVRRVGAVMCVSCWKTWWGRIVLVAVAILLALAARLIWLDRESGEPFALAEGISAWPTELMRAIAILTSVCFTIDVLRRARIADEEITADYFMATSDRRAVRQRVARAGPTWKQLFGRTWSVLKRMYAWGPDPRATSRVNAAEKWEEHLGQASLLSRWFRIVPVGLLYLGFAVCLIFLFGAPHAPIRGANTRRLDEIMLWFAIVSFVIVLFATLDTIRLCDRYTAYLNVSTETEWPRETVNRYQQEFGVKPEYLSSVLDVRLVADWTARTTQIVYYPFIVMSLVLVARARFFDSWDTPLGVVIGVLTAVVVAGGAAALLRNSAERTRRQALRRLQAAALKCKGTAELKDAGEQLDRVIAEIQNLRTGAFAPLSQQPFMRALLVPLGGVSGLAIVEYLVQNWL